MILPKDPVIKIDDQLIKHAQQLVDGLILEHGIYISLIVKTVPFSTYMGFTNSKTVTEIQYKVNDNTFDTLKELRKALENKAFL